MLHVTAHLQIALRHINGLTFTAFTPEVNTQLEICLREKRYQSPFWVPADDLLALQRQYESKLKKKAEPHIILDFLPQPTYRYIYNSDQFEYPCFSEVWDLMRTLDGERARSTEFHRPSSGQKANPTEKQSLQSIHACDSQQQREQNIYPVTAEATWRRTENSPLHTVHEITRHREQHTPDTRKHFNGLTGAHYSKAICRALEMRRKAAGYKSNFWVTEADIADLHNQYETKLKANAKPTHVRGNLSHRAFFNSEQFEYPCFSDVWGVTMKLDRRKSKLHDSTQFGFQGERVKGKPSGK
ncbi:hypothetical protein XU18_0578 [Perkinsela sp. CCAP 1560/4]|nr:hypothetical protein XU18_0578 [Perkinsela sp. CCAP 1560/4]|eukprot:KNH09300.1 hypothetical protein XU18_0578 [Perkinsela sp. CCAP 1560/4]